MVIDGGFSKAYHNETGIAGYTLVYHSRGFQLVQHEPFTSAEDAITRGTDIKSTTQIVEMSNRRMLVADTDIGQDLRKQIEHLQELLYALPTRLHQGNRKKEVKTKQDGISKYLNKKKCEQDGCKRAESPKSS